MAGLEAIHYALKASGSEFLCAQNASELCRRGNDSGGYVKRKGLLSSHIHETGHVQDILVRHEGGGIGTRPKWWVDLVIGDERAMEGNIVLGVRRRVDPGSGRGCRGRRMI